MIKLSFEIKFYVYAQKIREYTGVLKPDYLKFWLRRKKKEQFFLKYNLNNKIIL